MLNKKLIVVLLLCLPALTGCPSLPEKPAVRFLEKPPKEIPPLPPALREKREPVFCQKLLQLLNASPQTVQDLCGITTELSTSTPKPEPSATPNK